MDFPVEIHAPMTYEEKCEAIHSMATNLPEEYFYYKLVAIKMCPQNSGLTFVAVKDYVTPKINVYGTVDEFILFNIVKYYKPIPLKAAQIIFPEWNFTEENYGFERYETANGAMMR
ncbi:MAG: hypothetical protein ACSNEK_10020 [Parachlamydiaceae bacterium]